MVIERRRCELRFVPKDTRFRFFRGRKTFIKLDHQIILQLILRPLIGKAICEVVDIGKLIKLTPEDQRRIVVWL